MNIVKLQYLGDVCFWLSKFIIGNDILKNINVCNARKKNDCNVIRRQLIIFCMCQLICPHLTFHLRIKIFKLKTNNK